MKPFGRATLVPEQVERAVEQARAFVKGRGGSEEECDRAAAAMREEATAGTCWLNDRFQVIVRDVESPGWPAMVWLSIKRLDREPMHDWRDLQEIKNLLVGAENEGMELYPAESRLVDTANQYHLWVLKDPNHRFPIGWQSRAVTDEALGNSKQRPFVKS